MNILFISSRLGREEVLLRVHSRVWWGGKYKNWFLLLLQYYYIDSSTGTYTKRFDLQKLKTSWAVVKKFTVTEPLFRLIRIVLYKKARYVSQYVTCRVS